MYYNKNFNSKKSFTILAILIIISFTLSYLLISVLKRNETLAHVFNMSQFVEYDTVNCKENEDNLEFLNDDPQIHLKYSGEISLISLGFTQNMPDDLNVQVFYATDKEDFTEQNSIRGVLKQPSTTLTLKLPVGDYEKIRVDFDYPNNTLPGKPNIYIFNSKNLMKEILICTILIFIYLLAFALMLVNDKNKKLKSNILLLDLKDFSVKHKWYIVLIAFVYFAIYNSDLHMFASRIDIEIMLINPETYAGNLYIGRPFMAIFHYFLSYGDNFSVYYYSILAMVFFTLALLSIAFVFKAICNVQIKHSILPLLLIITSPLFVETNYFIMQSPVIAIGIILVSFSVLFSFEAIKTKTVYKYLFAIILAYMAIGIYQYFSLIYISFAITCIILKIIHSKKAIQIKEFLTNSINCILILGSSLILYLLTTSIFPSTGYISSGWSLRTFENNVNIIISFYKKHLFGQGELYDGYYGISSLLMIFAIIIALTKSKAKIHTIFITIFSCIVMVLTPFLLTTLLAYELGTWSQIMFPIATALNFIIIISIFSLYKLKKTNVAIVCIILFIGLQSINNSLTLIYMDDVRVMHDYKLAYTIEEEVKKLMEDDGEKPVAIIGQLRPNFNSIAINDSEYTYEQVSGRSAFQWDFNGIHSRRGYTLLESLGIPLIYPTSDQFEKAAILARDMSSWPLEGSVIETEELIIFKISDIEY